LETMVRPWSAANAQRACSTDVIETTLRERHEEMLRFEQDEETAFLALG